MIGIISTGIGNIRSVQCSLQRLGIACAVLSNPTQAAPCTGLILPGAGAAGAGMEVLQASGWDQLLQEWNRPLLGICLGMQLLFDTSEEADTACLGLIAGEVRKMPKVQIGWNQICETSNPKPQTSKNQSVYFINSYACFPSDASVITQTTTFASQQICAGVQSGNLWGVQWHPEKSGEFGNAYLLSFAQSCR